MTDDEREALGRAAHAGATRHCQYGHLYPKVREAYRVQGVKVAMVATEMCAKIAEGYANIDPDAYIAAKDIADAIREHFADADDAAEVIAYCEDCGKPVRVDDPAYGWDMESGVYVCATCLPKWQAKTLPTLQPGDAAEGIL